MVFTRRKWNIGGKIEKIEKKYYLNFEEKDYELLGNQYLDVVEEGSLKIKIEVYNFKINNAICMRQGKFVTLDSLIIENIKNDPNIKIFSNKGLIFVYFKIYAFRKIEDLLVYILNCILFSAVHAYSFLDAQRAVRNFSYQQTNRELVSFKNNTLIYNEKKLFDHLKEQLDKKNYLDTILKEVQYGENSYKESQIVIDYKIIKNTEVVDQMVKIKISPFNISCDINILQLKNKKKCHYL